MTTTTTNSKKELTGNNFDALAPESLGMTAIKASAASTLTSSLDAINLVDSFFLFVFVCE
jgi:hypothetical protein